MSTVFETTTATSAAIATKTVRISTTVPTAIVMFLTRSQSTLPGHHSVAKLVVRISRRREFGRRSKLLLKLSRQRRTRHVAMPRQSGHADAGSLNSAACAGASRACRRAQTLHAAKPRRAAAAASDPVNSIRTRFESASRSRRTWHLRPPCWSGSPAWRRCHADS